MEKLKSWLTVYNPDFSKPEYMQELLLLEAAKKLPDFLRSELDEMSRDKSEHSAKVALEVLAPLAGRLNMHGLKKKLEDIGFSTLHPDQYVLTTKMLKARNADTHKDIQKFIIELEAAISDAGVKDADISGRTKQPYSLYKKLNKTGTIEDIHDLLAVRVLVASESDCYRVLDVLHGVYESNLDRFKDYVKQPKANGYRSLHSTIRKGKKSIEVQIRTLEMHEQAESGQAAYWQYDQHKKTKNYRRGQAANSGQKNGEYIYAFSPTGDVYRLKAPATPLDFAYAVHSNVGARTKSVKVNGKIMPLDGQLRNGDQVEVLTGKEAKPKHDWLGFVTSRKARGKIKNSLRQAESDRYLQVGKELLNEHFDGRVPDLRPALELLGKKNDEELYLSIGRNDIGPAAVQRLLEPEPPAEERLTTTAVKTAGRPVVVAGIEGLQYRLANCCRPAPPTPIVGYITRSLGLTIHRRDCEEVRMAEKERVVACGWR